MWSAQEESWMKIKGEAAEAKRNWVMCDWKIKLGKSFICLLRVYNKIAGILANVSGISPIE